MAAPIPGTIRFHQKCDPPLKAGKYSVDVRQRVNQLANREFTNAGGFSFTVGGPRFSLAPADIYCIYPPDGAAGDFADSLPHIVFTRRTIPWERNLQPGNSAMPDRPWMALLLLSAEDGADGKEIPPIVPRNVSDLIAPRESGVAGPKIPNLEDYEKKDPCNTVDLDTRLFRKIAPRAADLEYLAHVREVNTDNKETLSFLADGWFSVVIGNRFPKRQEAVPADDDKGAESKAILVSLEGVSLDSQNAGSVRLAVLASWTFRCYRKIEFSASVKALGDPLQTLRLTLPENAPGAPDALRYVRAAFSQGYAPLNHNTRIGDTTFSWYRSPLTPMQIERRFDYEFAPVPDGLVRYDYKKGLMDVGYAAASQLGRLLGLQDLAFAQTLCAWRTQVQTQLKAQLRKEQLQRSVNSGAPLEGSESEFLELVLKDALQARSGNQPAATQGEGESFTKLVEKAVSDQSPPLAVRQWLTRRVLFYGVPFPYLVPDPRMLPVDSMRFFRLDPEWVKCLLEGACSVGRSTSEEQLVDEKLRGSFFDLVMEKCDSVRQRLPEDEVPVPKETTGVTWPLEGFLLRSPVVEGWQGLEMEASYWQGKEAKPATTLRIDRLGPDILLCIFNGPLAKIVIRQPPEGMHFGAAYERGKYCKNILRSVKELQDGGRAPGDQIDLNPAIAIPSRKDGDPRVIDVAELAKILRDALMTKKGMDPGKPFTSAVFGVQMTESPARVEITVRERP
jgi:hypothetical protein